MAKKVLTVIKLQIPGGQANPAPPVGPALGQHGVLIKEALRLDKGSAEPNRTKVGKLTKAQLRSIAETKIVDLNARDVEQAMQVIAGTARSMGVEVEA